MDPLPFGVVGSDDALPQTIVAPVSCKAMPPRRTAARCPEESTDVTDSYRAGTDVGTLAPPTPHRPFVHRPEFGH